MNFARRDTCNRCQTPRSGGGGDSEYLCINHVSFDPVTFPMDEKWCLIFTLYLRIISSSVNKVL